MPEFKKIQDLLTTENPTKAVVLDNNNELKLADYAGGGTQEEYVVTFNGENDEWFADKTFAEITDAINSGKKVVADYAYYEPAQRLQMVASLEGVGYVFAGVIAGDHVEMIGIVMQSDDTIFVINGEALPSVDNDDNGKVLTVVNGKWQVENSAAGTAYIDITMTSDTTFTASYKGQPATVDTIIGLVNDDFTVIAKVAAGNVYQFVPLAAINTDDDDNSKSSCVFSTTVLNEGSPALLLAKITSDDGSTGNVSFTPI